MGGSEEPPVRAENSRCMSVIIEKHSVVVVVVVVILHFVVVGQERCGLITHVPEPDGVIACGGDEERAVW